MYFNVYEYELFNQQAKKHHNHTNNLIMWAVIFLSLVPDDNACVLHK